MTSNSLCDIVCLQVSNTKRDKRVGGDNQMDYARINVVAKEVAKILAENEVTIADVTEIFKTVKDYLIVRYDSEREVSKWE